MAYANALRDLFHGQVMEPCLSKELYARFKDSQPQSRCLRVWPALFGSGRGHGDSYPPLSFYNQNSIRVGISPAAGIGIDKTFNINRNRCLSENAPRAARKNQPTIYDITRVTGVNPSRVSRALSNPGRVHAKTGQRIRDAATALDYRTDPMARAPPTGMTNTVGFLISGITNPVYFDFIREAGRPTEAEGYTLVPAESQELEAQTVQRLLASVDGLVLEGTRLSESDIGAFAERRPVILVNRAVPGGPCCARAAVLCPGGVSFPTSSRESDTR